VVVDVAGLGGLDDEDCMNLLIGYAEGTSVGEICTIFVSYGFADGYATLVV
jgi:hypothetical protein